MFTVQVFNGDVGGLDLDFEAETLEEARTVARAETLPGTRGTQILDGDYALVETLEA